MRPPPVSVARNSASDAEAATSAQDEMPLAYTMKSPAWEGMEYGLLISGP